MDILKLTLAKLALAATVLLLVTTDGIAAPATALLFDQAGCGTNCVQSLRSTNNLIVVAKNSDGAVFKTLSFAIPGNARLLHADDAGADYPTARNSPMHATSNSTTGAGSECVNTPGVCTVSTVRTYVTPSYYIFYTYTFVFNDGNLVEMNVEETRTARNFIN